MSVILLETLATNRAGEPIYFRMMTPIGPALTSSFSEAALFSSVYDAMQSTAYAFWLCDFVPIKAHNDEEVWDILTVPSDTNETR